MLPPKALHLNHHLSLTNQTPQVCQTGILVVFTYTTHWQGMSAALDFFFFFHKCNILKLGYGARYLDRVNQGVMLGGWQQYAENFINLNTAGYHHPNLVYLTSLCLK